MNMDQLDPMTLDPNAGGFEPPKRRGWWSRNWIWFVPTMFLVMVIFCCGCPLGILFAFYGAIFNSEPFLGAMQKVQADPAVRQELGQPIEMVYWPPPNARIEIKDDRGEADMHWEIEGPKGRARAHVTARMIDGQWGIVVLEVRLANGKKLLLSGEGGNEAPPFENLAPPAAQPEQKAPAPEIQLAVPQA